MEPLAGWEDAVDVVVAGLPDDPAPAGVLEAGAGLEAATGVDVVPRVSRGRSSLLLVLLSIPTGTSSALRVAFGPSTPLGRYEPAPIHGCGAFFVLLCSAPLTVNSPSESPACSAS